MSHVEIAERVQLITKSEWRAAPSRAELVRAWPWHTWAPPSAATEAGSRHTVVVHRTDGQHWEPPSITRSDQPRLRLDLRSLRLEVSTQGVEVAFEPPDHVVPRRSRFPLGSLALGETLRVSVNWKQVARGSGGDWLYVDVVTVIRVDDLSAPDPLPWTRSSTHPIAPSTSARSSADHAQEVRRPSRATVTRLDIRVVGARDARGARGTTKPVRSARRRALQDDEHTGTAVPSTQKG